MSYRVLVTGHLGYIGTVLTPMLVARGHAVVGLDSDLFRDCTFGSAGVLAAVPHIAKDIRDVELADVEGFDAVLHLAGLSNDPLGDLNPELTFEINHQASVRLAELAKQAGVRRFLYASSCSNYGASGDDLLDESASFNPVTPYGISKVRSEQGIGPLAGDGFEPVFLRASTAYGVSPRLRFDLVLNNLTAWAFTTGQVYLKSDGTPWRPVVHVADIAAAYVALLEAPSEAVAGRAFNIGRTDQNFRISELAEVVRETVPNCRIEYAPDAGPDKRCYRVSCDELARSVSAYQPMWDVRKGAVQLYQAFRSHGLKQPEFEGPTYQRLAHLKQLLSAGVVDETLRPLSAARGWGK